MRQGLGGLTGTNLERAGWLVVTKCFLGAGRYQQLTGTAPLSPNPVGGLHLAPGHQLPELVGGARPLYLRCRGTPSPQTSTPHSWVAPEGRRPRSLGGFRPSAVVPAAPSLLDFLRQLQEAVAVQGRDLGGQLGVGPLQPVYQVALEL